MDKLYALLYTLACVLLILDAFAGSSREHVMTRLLPLGIFFAVLVVTIQAWKAV